VTDRAEAPEYRISRSAPIEAELSRIVSAEIEFAHCLAAGKADDVRRTTSTAGCAMPEDCSPPAGMPT
jgi:hypothetical protein